jgi:hypothetical protein
MERGAVPASHIMRTASQPYPALTGREFRRPLAI